MNTAELRAAAILIATLGFAGLNPAYAYYASLKNERTELLDACNATAHATTLVPAKQSITDARAIWLNATTIQWPGVAFATNETFVLYASASGGIVARKGEKIAGETRRIVLSRRTSPLPEAITSRFKYLAAGAVVELPSNQQKQIGALLREQVVIAREDAAGHVLDVTTLQHPGALDEHYHRAETLGDLGAVVERSRTTFRVWAPTARGVQLCMYDSPAGAASSVQPMQLDERSGTWLHRAASRSERYYTYLVDVWVNGVGFVRNRVTDPYSQTLSADSKRSMAIDLNDASLFPKNWNAVNARHRVRHAVDMSIYELHVRDFSITDVSVPETKRGKYLGFTERNSRGMQHLEKLSKAGLTDIHLLPVFDIATVPEIGCVTPKIEANQTNTAASETQQAEIAKVRERDCFNWGYDPYHFNAPEGSYATNAQDGRIRIREFREMVQALNEIGLRAGKDVVYNHMSTSGQNEKSVLDRIVPGYYHRLNAEGKIETSTCCDNTATEHRMMEKLMSDSVLMWAKHYKIDSFRFDLMGHQPRAAMERMQARLKKDLGREIQFLGEGWNFGEVENGKRFVQASQLSLNGTGIGTFTDRLRDAARGGGYGDDANGLVRNQGYLNGLVYDLNEANAAAPIDDSARKRLMKTADMIRVGLAGSIRDYTMVTFDDSHKRLEQIDYNGQAAGYVTQPSEVVNYVENHDNETLFDFNVYKMPLTVTRDERARVQVLGIALTALAQGVPYYHAGIDILRSKSMDRNSYDSGDWFNRIDWTYRDNGFASGLPRKDDNGDKWPIIAPRLINENIKPTQREIEWTAAAMRDLLAIRASSTLFRMRTATDIKQRLKFFNVGVAQIPTVIAAELVGTGYAGANFERVFFLINVDKMPQQIVNAKLVGAALTPHPRLADINSASPSVALGATFDTKTGAFAIPARSVAVFVETQK